MHMCTHTHTCMHRHTYESNDIVLLQIQESKQPHTMHTTSHVLHHSMITIPCESDKSHLFGQFIIDQWQLDAMKWQFSLQAGLFHKIVLRKGEKKNIQTQESTTDKISGLHIWLWFATWSHTAGSSPTNLSKKKKKEKKERAHSSGGELWPLRERTIQNVQPPLPFSQQVWKRNDEGNVHRPWTPHQPHLDLAWKATLAAVHPSLTPSGQSYVGRPWSQTCYDRSNEAKKNKRHEKATSRDQPVVGGGGGEN